MGLQGAFDYNNYSYGSDCYLRCAVGKRDKAKKQMTVELCVYKDKATRDANVNNYFLHLGQSVSNTDWDTYFDNTNELEANIYTYLKAVPFKEIDLSTLTDI